MNYSMGRKSKKTASNFPEPIQGARWIPLNKGLFALVDEEDFDLVSPYTWTAMICDRTTYGYFKRIIDGKVRCVFLHKVVMGEPEGMQVDHKDGNGLDSRKANLRICTCKQNHQNMRKQNRPTSSLFKGVSWDKTREKWLVKLKTGGRYFNLGRFASEEEAARAYDAAAIEHFGEFACLNFPAAIAASA